MVIFTGFFNKAEASVTIESGIVAEKDRAQMVDTVYINLRKNSIDKTQLMILDMLANFDWKRPIYMTQVYILQDFGLMDYLQFDGYAYRLVPILTPTQNPYEAALSTGVPLHDGSLRALQELGLAQ